MKGVDELVSHLDASKPVYIQAHDFPDHDAVASAFGLMHLLESRGVGSSLCYGGTIQSESLSEAIKLLEVPIYSTRLLAFDDDAQLILVDGFIGNRNMTGLPGTVVAVIDHHKPPEEPDCAYHDIRPDYGSCSTIFYEYFRGADVPMKKSVATMLLMGLMMDTAFMTRGVAPIDLEAFSTLYFQGDWETGSRLLKNSLSLSDLGLFREAINSCEVADDFAFIMLEQECTSEAMALVADFFLGLRELHFVCVVEPDRDEYRISVRSEDSARPSDVVLRRALKGLGSGGGHVHMGGGSIPRDLFPGEQGLRKRFLQAMGKE